MYVNAFMHVYIYHGWSSSTAVLCKKGTQLRIVVLLVVPVVGSCRWRPVVHGDDLLRRRLPLGLDIVFVVALQRGRRHHTYAAHTVQLQHRARCTRKHDRGRTRELSPT